jgi:hypothetical protein
MDRRSAPIDIPPRRHDAWLCSTGLCSRGCSCDDQQPLWCRFYQITAAASLTTKSARVKKGRLAVLSKSA